MTVKTFLDTNIVLYAIGQDPHKKAVARQLIAAERFLIAVNQEKFNYTEWRCHGLPDVSIEQIAAAANQYASQPGKNLND